jgi:hypothetical protein
VCAQIQETGIELLQKLHEQLTRKETLVGDNSCYLSHNYPSKKVVSLAMASHLQFCPQASMHSNNMNILAGFFGRICFGVQIQKLMKLGLFCQSSLEY